MFETRGAFGDKDNVCLLPLGMIADPSHVTSQQLVLLLFVFDRLAFDANDLSRGVNFDTKTKNIYMKHALPNRTRRAMLWMPPRQSAVAVRRVKTPSEKQHTTKCNRKRVLVDDPLPMVKWRKVLESQPAFKLQKERELHHAHCRDDPMYQMIHGPQEMLEFRDSDSGQVVRRVAFADRVLQVAWDIVRRRVPEMEQMPMVKRIAERISSEELIDPELKLFVLCFLISWFPHVREFFQSLYPNDTERAKRRRENFDALPQHLEVWCRGVTHSGYNVSSMDPIMELFLYRDLIPNYSTGLLPVGTPIYDDQMQAYHKQAREQRQKEKDRKEMIRMRKRALAHAF